MGKNKNRNATTKPATTPAEGNTEAEEVKTKKPRMTAEEKKAKLLEQVARLEERERAKARKASPTAVAVTLALRAIRKARKLAEAEGDHSLTGLCNEAHDALNTWEPQAEQEAD